MIAYTGRGERVGRSPDCPSDDALAALAGRTLPDSEAEALGAHLDSCESCRATMVALVRGGAVARSPTSDSAPAGTRLGRYELRRWIGRGGMGDVYEAFDGELARPVALKLLRPGSRTGSAERDARLRREAQALARMVHPNVVTIFDVGELDGRMFLAMEYVPGGTLRTWMESERRSWREVIEMFAGAARGLAAVHARGLVHRDFKPENVLVGERGEAKVTDFGLVTALEEATAPSDAAGAIAVDSLTKTGALLGTPAYMAPEQLTSGTSDARSDQFSFCVSLYEALYGARPFEGKTIAELRAALAAPARLSAVRPGAPRWLYRVVMRGLAIDPAERFSSVDALAAAMSPARRQQRQRIATVVAAIVATGGAVAVVARPSAESSCAAAGAEIDSVWSPVNRVALESAFGSTHVPYAADAAMAVSGVIDRYATQWRASYTRVCEATRVHRTQSAPVMDLRTACLAARERELTTLLDVLATPSPRIVEHALDLAAQLAPLEQCDDVAALSGAPPPADPLARSLLAAARANASRARDEMAAGMFAEARPIVASLARVARELHDPPFAHEVELLRGELETDEGHGSAAAETFRAAITGADRDHDDADRAWAWDRLADVLVTSGKLAELDPIEQFAQAAIDRAGNDAALAQAWDLTRARIAQSRGDADEAVRRYESAISRARMRDDRRALGDLLQRRVEATIDRVDPNRSLELANQALATTLEAYGSRHPQFADRERLVAELLSLLGRRPEAMAKAMDAFEIDLAAYGPSHYKTAEAESVVGKLELFAGNLDEARRHALHVVELATAAGHGEDDIAADALRVLGLIEQKANRLDLAVEYQQRSLDLIVAQRPHSQDVVYGYLALGLFTVAVHQKARAEAALRAGIALGEQNAPHNPQLGLLYLELGDLRLAAGAAGLNEAEQLLEHANALLDEKVVDPVNVALARLALAHVKAKRGRWAEARALVLAAKPSLPASDPDLRGLLDETARHAAR